MEEGNTEPIEGWDFSWFDGRATEARPSWRYFEGLIERIRTTNAVLDVQTGGGERFSEALQGLPLMPRRIAATESWAPNVVIARRRLEPLGVSVFQVSETEQLPFTDESFDLVCSRHPTVTPWTEIARVLAIGGSYYSQQIGAGTNSELTDFMMDLQPKSEDRNVDRAVVLAESAGLEVIDVREESMPVEFFDVGAVIYFLRKVIWTVPDFSTDKYWERVKQMHEYIEENGSFTSYSRRYLIEARKER